MAPYLLKSQATGKDKPNMNPITISKQAETLGYKLLIADGYIAVVPLDRENYTAEVYKAYPGPCWGVQTTSYGSVSPETVDLVIDGLKRAQKLVKLLNEAGL